MIRTTRYVDICDLPEDAQSAYHDFVCSCGVSNGEHWCWTVGESAPDSVPESWIGPEKCCIIDAALRDLGLQDGEIISLVSEW